MSHLPLLEVIQDLAKFSPAVVSHLVQDDDSQVSTLGKVARNGNIAAIAKGANLDIINLSSNERLAAWSFCSSSQEPETEITCLVPFSADPSSKNTSHVLVGLDTGLHGLLAVFDITESRVVRAVALPQRVGSLALVAGCGGPATPPYLHPALLYFHGIVAVGMMEGRTMLIDLNMDEAVESSDSSPAGLFFISAQSRDLARLRRKAIEEGTHLGLEVAVFTQGETFTWDKVTFPSDCVQVTCLHYCPQLATLAVGYNCGAWLLLPLTPPLQPSYTSPYTPNTPPVVGLTWQEPLDDPRHYTYYWVMRGAGDTLATASLYSITFRNRQWDLVEGPCYDNLESVTLRFEHELGGDPGQGGAELSRVICVDTLELSLGTGGTQDRSGGSEVETLRDLGLVVMVWECDKAVTYMGVFDINCWYQAQMPGGVVDGGGLCSYFSLCEVADGGVVDIKVDTDSIAKFGPSSVVEQHFYPSSLKFNLMVVTRDGLTMATHLGLQRKVLAELGRPSSLVQPSELYQFCLLSGLATGPQLEPSLLTQRKTLLTVALEQSMVGVVVAAIRDWADGRYSKAGCSLKFLLDWAWNKVIYIKEMIDRQTVPLFDHSLTEVDVAARGTLVSLAGQLAQLVTVLSSLASMGGIMTDIGQDQLECRLNVTGLVLLYTQAISWFVNVGLLPEQGEGPGNPFPVSQLERQYRDKRNNMAGLQGVYGRPGLMVDILCEDIGDDLICSFQKAGGSGSYPPPSLHSLITTFLSESPAPAKLRLVQYFFLDLAHLLPPDQFPELVDSLIKFPSAFSLPPSVIKLTQAFWLLDHEDWEEAVSMMLDPLLQEDDLTPTHHRAILVSLLAQSQPSLALKYTRIRRPPCMLPQDVCLHISVLLANGAIQEAFTFQRSRRGTASSSNILAQFYNRAEELGKLDAVLQLSLTVQEEKEFVIFLQSSSRADSQEVLLMYYLQRSRFTEAMQLNMSLKTLGKGGTSAREAIMDRYNHILPGLASTLGSRRVTLTSAQGMGTRPVPLSVTLQDRNIRLSSHASAIEARLSTPLSGRQLHDNQFTPFRARGRRGEGKEGIVRPTDVTQNCKRKAEEELPTICYPNETFQETSLMSSTKMNGTALVSPPRKRTRLSDVSTLNMSVKSMRRMSRYMTAEAITILSTPTINKVRKAASGFRADTSTAPASILKVKQLIKEVIPDEGDKILDVSLSLDNTPIMGSREITPTKSLRFREPRNFPSDLAIKTPVVPILGVTKPTADDSQVSNDTDDSFHSFNSGQMDVDSPMRPSVDSPLRSTFDNSFKPKVDSPLTFKSVVDNPLSSKSFGGRPSIGTLSRNTETVTTSIHSVSLTVTEEDGKVITEESSQVHSGITITSLSPSTKAELEEVLKKAENKLKQKEKSVLVPEEGIRINKVYEEVEKEDKKASGLLGAKDLVLQLEGEDSQDSDIFMHGKSWERKVGTSDDTKLDEKSDTGDDYESEDDKFYDNKVFEKKECDIVLESSEDSKDSEVDAKVSDESKDSEVHDVSWNKKLDVEKSKVANVDDEDSKDCEVIIDTSEDEVDKASSDVEELDESDESDSEVKDLNFSWAPQGNNIITEKRNITIADEIKKIVAEENSVEVVEDVEESVIIDEDFEVEDDVVEEVESREPVHATVDEKSRISTIDLEDSVDEKVAPQLNFSSDAEESMEVDEVIEIESDEEQNADEKYADKEQTGKVLFSSLFSQSSHESDEELEVSNVEVSTEPVENVEEEVSVELVTVEDSGNSVEIPLKESEPEASAETGAVLFSNFGGEEKDESVIEAEVFKRDIDEVKEKPKVDIDAILEVSDESEHEPEEDPVYFEEAEPFDLEADFFSPSTTSRKTFDEKPISASSSYSYDVCTSDVTQDRKPTERKIEIPVPHTADTNPMDLVNKIIAEATAGENNESIFVTKEAEEKEGSTLSLELPMFKDPSTQIDELEPDDHEDDEMRDLLDRVSTTATRASSIAGSIFGENRAGSVSGSVFGDIIAGHGPTFSFSEPEHLEQGDQEQEDEESRLNYSFSTPLDSSQIEDTETVDISERKDLNKYDDASQESVEIYDKLELRNRTVTEPFSLVSNFGLSSSDPAMSIEDPSVNTSNEEKKSSCDSEDQQEEDDDEEDDDEAEEEDDEAKEENSSSEESDDDEQPGGLEFSWTTIPPQSTANVFQLVDEEVKSEASNIFTPIGKKKSPFLFGKPESGYNKELEQESPAQLLFSAPSVESEPLNVDLNDSQFEFGEPHDASMDMDAIENIDVDPKVEIANISKSVEKITTPIKPKKTVTPVRRSTRKASQTRDEEVITRSDTLPFEVTPLKTVKSSKATPAKATPKKTPAKHAVLEDEANIIGKIAREKSLSSQDQEYITASGRPTRGRSTRVSSVDTESVSSLKAPSLASTEPMESDSEDREKEFGANEVFEQVPLAPPSSTKKRGRPRKDANTPVVDKIDTPSTESKISIMDFSTSIRLASSKAATVPMETGSVSSDASAKLQKTTITSELDDLSIASKTTPATPIRRSRRISGVTPASTPVLERSRRISGPAPGDKIKPLQLLTTPGKKFDQLELRNRTVVETLSLVSDLGKYKDTTEEDNKAKETKKSVTPRNELNISISQRKSRRRSNISITPDGSPASTSRLSSPITESMSTSPKEIAAKRSIRPSRKAANTSLTESESDVEVAAPTPSTPVKASALPKHLTPLKKVLTPKKEDLPLTPTRRSRRLSSGDVGSGEPLTPSRRSRRLSGAADAMDSAPDGGLITGGTPRKTPSTPRSRRHTSVRPEDVESALEIAGVAPLPTLIEEEEKDDTIEKEENIEERKEIQVDVAPVKRGRKAKPSNPNLNIISEEDTSGSEISGMHDQTVGDSSVFFPMKSKSKKRGAEELTPEAPPKRRSRRVTITTLGTDVDLFTPVKDTPASTSGTSRRESTGGAANKKKYVPVKRKTSVRIK